MPVGVIVNNIAVLAGGLLGALFGTHFPEKLKAALPQIFGLSAIAIGIGLIMQMKSVPPVVLALIVGTSLGELLDLESALERGLYGLQRRFPVRMDEQRADVLVSMIVLFCFSSTGILGTMTAAMTGDNTILFAKSIMDFFTAAIFAASAGFLVGCVAVPQLCLGLALFAVSSQLVPLCSAGMLADFKGCGGIITLAVGLKIAGLGKFRVMNMLPALALVLPLSALWAAAF